MLLEHKVPAEFETRFGAPPAILVRAPGRVNLIGEHTDYNDGFVLPMAIDRAIWIALRPRPDRQVLAHSVDFDETAQFSLDRLEKQTGWIEYLKGVAWALLEAGYTLAGFEAVVAGDARRGRALRRHHALRPAHGLAPSHPGGPRGLPRQAPRAGRGGRAAGRRGEVGVGAHEDRCRRRLHGDRPGRMAAGIDP